MPERMLCVVAAAAIATGLSIPIAAQAQTECATLADMKIEDTNLLSSAVVAATDDLPEYCRVLGYVRPAINFEIRLPTADWNSKFYMTGCGAQCGRIRSDIPGFTNAINHGLRRNYAVSTMDGGHWGATIFDSLWVQVRDPIATFDHAQRAVTETARVTKEVITAFYGSAPERSYFAGCSNGGRQANMEALRYPDDFDGIISGCPSLFPLGDVGWAWAVKVNIGPDGGPIFDFAKLPMLTNAVYAACAGEDGLVDEPLQCEFEPSELACTGSDGADCLTAAEVEVVEKWYDGPRDSDGEQIFPGVPRGSEPYWPLWLALEDEQTWAGDKAAIEELLRYASFDEVLPADFDVAEFDFDTDPDRIVAARADYDASGTDLSAFRASGGKLLVYHGLADSKVPVDATTQWFEALIEASGGAAQTADFVRLFLVPGFDHCGTLSGPGVHHSGFDPLPALEKWVEEGIPPESIIMTKTDDAGATEWTRPVCVFPNVAKYSGSGDLKDAANWTCGGG